MRALTTIGTALAAALAMAALASGAAQPRPGTGGPHYDARGRLILPADYREWVFLSAGLDMNYGQAGAMPKEHVFGNVFAPREAYRAFLRTGVWPDKTVLLVENRVGSTKGSINKSGQFQSDLINQEAHVKDVARFKGGWGFFVFDGAAPAALTTTAACYACHRDHAAADTTFVQFYPTLLPVAERLKTLSPAYLAER